MAAEIAYEGDPEFLWSCLRASGIIDEIADTGVLYVHDWHDHAPDFIRKRLDRGGETFANGFPARIPQGEDKVKSYYRCGWKRPDVVPYGETLANHRRDGGETTAIQTLENVRGETAASQDPRKTEGMDSQRLATGETEPPKTEGDGEAVSSLTRAEAQTRPDQNIREEDSSFSETGGGEPRAPDPTPAGTSETLVPSGSPPAGEAGETTPEGLPTYVPGQGKALIERERQPGESDDQVLDRLRRQRRGETNRLRPVAPNPLGVIRG